MPLRRGTSTSPGCSISSRMAFLSTPGLTRSGTRGRPREPAKPGPFCPGSPQHDLLTGPRPYRQDHPGVVTANRASVLEGLALLLDLRRRLRLRVILQGPTLQATG